MKFLICKVGTGLFVGFFAYQLFSMNRRARLRLKVLEGAFQNLSNEVSIGLLERVCNLVDLYYMMLKARVINSNTRSDSISGTTHHFSYNILLTMTT